MSDQTPEKSPHGVSPALDELYRGLAHAHMMSEDLQTQLAADVEQLQAKQGELQERQAATEPGTDEADQIDAELEQLDQAIAAAQAQLPDDDQGGPSAEDQHPEHDRHQ